MGKNAPIFLCVALINHVKKELYISMVAIIGGLLLNTSASLYQSTVGIVRYVEKLFPFFPISSFLGLVWLRPLARRPLIEEGKETASKRFQKALSPQLLAEFQLQLSNGGGTDTWHKLAVLLFGSRADLFILGRRRIYFAFIQKV